MQTQPIFPKSAKDNVGLIDLANLLRIVRCTFAHF